MTLARNGYETAAFVSGHTAKSHIAGLGGWFHHYSDSLVPWSRLFGIDSFELLIPYRVVERFFSNDLVDARIVNLRVQKWLTSRSPSPFFVWVQYYEPHGPHVAPDGAGIEKVLERNPGISREFANYIAEVEFVDRQLGALLEIFASRQVLQNTLIIVSSEHGEAFGEPHPHIEKGHDKQLYDSVLRVPLVISGASVDRSGSVVTSLMENIDIAPTILDQIGIEVPSTFIGRSVVTDISLVPLATERTAFSQTSPGAEPRWFSIRSSTDKLIVSPDKQIEEWSDLVTDPDELINGIDEVGLDKLRKYRADLVERLQLGDSKAVRRFLTPDEVQGFRDLNYIED